MDGDPTEFNKESSEILCPSCMSAIDPNETFCPKCGSPIGTLANADPMGSIRAQGFLLGKATEGRPKLIVLIGMWIMFFPALIGCAGLAISIIYNRAGTGASDFVFFWIGAALSFAFGVILFKVTRNYLKPIEMKIDADTES